MCYRKVLAKLPLCRITRLRHTRNLHVRMFELRWFCLFLRVFNHMETSPLQVKGCKFWPMLGTYWRSAVRFSVPYLLWQVASVYNGHLRGPKTLTPITERSAVEISLPVLITYVYRGGDSNTQLPACGVNALTTDLTDCVTHSPWITNETLEAYCFHIVW